MKLVITTYKKHKYLSSSFSCIRCNKNFKNEDEIVQPINKFLYHPKCLWEALIVSIKENIKEYNVLQSMLSKLSTHLNKKKRKSKKD